MNVLVFGGGGREHALVWKLRQSPRDEKIYCAPGNAGIAREADCVPADLGDIPSLAALAEKLRVDLTVVGPEAPLVAGVADEFARRGLAIVGPSKAAAELEGSKVFAKQFMKRHAIPTAPFHACREAGDAYSALCAVEWPVVIKADGLAAGKGVRIAQTPDEATAIIEAFMEKRELGAAGERVVIEDCLAGEEVSFIVLADGEKFVPLALARDHKRVFDSDRGPNTGGMGAYSDDALVETVVWDRILKQIVQPVLRGLRDEDRPYKGFLYFGLMLTRDGPQVLEFNCRLGDPETQPLLLRLESDLAEALEKAAAGRLDEVQLKWSGDAAACVVLASGGYPGKFETGRSITGIEEAEKLPGVKVFHAGTKEVGGQLVTAGGRVLGVTAGAGSLAAARELAYRAVDKIRFEGMHCRRDIAARALASQPAGRTG